LKPLLPTTMVGIALLAALPASAERLRLTCTARGLPLGAQVWIEVEPQYREIAAPTPADTRLRESRPPVAAAEGKRAWQFEVPPSGQVAPTVQDFTFPATVDWTSPSSPGQPIRAIYLKTRFRIDTPGQPPRAGYGEIQEATLGMSVPPEASEVSRCLRLRAEAGRLALESAADCSEASFTRAQSDEQVHVRLRVPPGSPPPPRDPAR
jgi:hypothetical protein